jgi:hypothetical protein
MSIGHTMTISSPSNHILQTTEDFVLVDQNAVLGYLITRQELVPYLAQIVHYARSIYGDDTTVSLRRDWDPDSETDLEYLIAGIRTAISPEDAYQHLYRLREDWWFGVPEGVQNQVPIVNEFE